VVFGIRIGKWYSRWTSGAGVRAPLRGGAVEGAVAQWGQQPQSQREWRLGESDPLSSLQP
jgi:hypothetical protein